MAAFTATSNHAAAAGSPPPEGREEAEAVLDEFTAPAEKSGCLERSRAGIERLFRVRLAVLGSLGSGGWAALDLGQQQNVAAGRRIWLSLRGQREDVRAAKEYIKGLCEPELEEREHYPKDMHCIFVGAQSLFLNCLIQGTCADITVVEIGTLNIKGGAEPVVMARSHVQQFVSLFKNNTSLLNSRESEVKKQFKQLVEAHADKYTMDLLILPSSLKRELLSLAQSKSQKADGKSVDLANFDGTPELLPNEIQKLPAMSNDCRTGREEARNNAGTPVTELAKQMDTLFPDAPERHFLPINGLNSLETSACKERQSCKRRSSDAEERLPKKQFSLENNQETKQPVCTATDSVVLVDLVTDGSSEMDDPGLNTKEGDEISEEMEYNILVNFFKSMGYSQYVVEKVIGDLGQLAEPLLLLEEIEKESKRGPEERDRTADLPWTAGTWTEKDKGSSSSKGQQEPGLKLQPPKTAKQNITSVPRAQCKVEGRPHISNNENQTRLSGSQNPQYKGCSKVVSNYCYEQSRTSQTNDIETDGHVNACDSMQRVMKDRKPKEPSLVARGGSETPRPPAEKETVVLQACPDPSSAKHDQHGRCNPLQLGARQLPSQNPSHLLEPLQITAPSSQRRKGEPYSHHADPPVTGVQRFKESLKTPYKLELKNEPGRDHLKYIVIDGSNVAISHGLQKIFSCRGIAIAVDYFWKRGHRKITVFVPQWRTRRDSNITEQHFLTQLQDVGILALTPARVVFGARIASHDDRFLLHLAEKTGGVIVTNDNLREFVDESASWREIIQKRLLPYTFVGDLFMVPDDPLGRNGPRIERFLQEETRFRGVPPQYGLASGGPPPFGTSHFLMQTNGSGQLPKNSLPGLVPALTMFPPAPHANLALPPHPRSTAETIHLREALRKIFPTSEQREKIEEILAQHPHMRDMNALSAMVLDLG